MRTSRASRWIPVAVAAGAVPTFLAFWFGGRPALGAAWAALPLLAALALVTARGSDTARMLRGELDDERTLALEAQAMTITAVVTGGALVALFLADAARGGTGLVYGALLVLGELTHVAALAILNRRS